MQPNRKETIVANDPGPCPACSMYGECMILCEKAELWADQDTVGRSSRVLLENRHRTGSEKRLDDYIDYVSFHNQNVVIPDSTLSMEAWRDVCSMRLSDKIIRMIYSYYMLGKRIRDIAIDEKTSSQTIDQRHIQAKKSIAKRLQQRELWLKIRGMLEYKSIRDYDVCYLFFCAGYPRKIIAKIMRLHVSTVIKIIRKKYNELGDINLC
jgi:hypothetical protein